VIGARTAAAAAVCATAACTILTHAEDYAVAPPGVDTRLCAACPQSPQLRHPPCPATSVSPSADPSVRFYAMQTINFGAHASDWGTTFFHPGFDMDCSARPGGTPTSCTTSGPLSPAWVSLPDGTDNAFGVQILASILTGSQRIDVQQAVNDSITRGEWSWILAIDHWNATPDDANVGVRLLQAAGPTAGGPPTWASDETWIAYADAWDPAFATGALPDTPFKTDGAYVTQGTLVWDTRALPLQTLLVRNGPAVLPLAMEPVGLFGQLTEGSLQQGSFGGLLQNEILFFGLLDLASGCDLSKACALAGPLAGTVASVQDMVSLTTPGETFCNRISFGAAPYFVQIGGVSGIAPTTAEPVSCDIQRQLACGDAGTDAGTD
jgi:hypothetical protein